MGREAKQLLHPIPWSGIGRAESALHLIPAWHNFNSEVIIIIIIIIIILMPCLRCNSLVEVKPVPIFRYVVAQNT
jgi:hypothetical protein